jgi:hypothetical protein
MVYRHCENDQDFDGNVVRKEETGGINQAEEEMLGPDGQVYPKHTKTISGMRPTAAVPGEDLSDEDPVVQVNETVEIGEDQNGDLVKHDTRLTRSDVLRLFDYTKDEMPTSPDLSALMDQARLYDRARKELLEVESVDASEEPGEELTRLVSEAEMAALTVLNSSSGLSVDPATRWLPSAAGTVVKVLDRTRKPGDIPWWISNNSVVRLWGQIHCGLQVFEDMQLLRDLVDVLGIQWLDATNDGDGIKFTYMTQHVDQLKKEIRQKYPELEKVFNVIIRMHE